MRKASPVEKLQPADPEASALSGVFIDPLVSSVQKTQCLGTGCSRQPMRRVLVEGILTLLGLVDLDLGGLLEGNRQ